MSDEHKTAEKCRDAAAKQPRAEDGTMEPGDRHVAVTLPDADRPKKNTAAQIADEAGVSRRTVEGAKETPASTFVLRLLPKQRERLLREAVRRVENGEAARVSQGAVVRDALAAYFQAKGWNLR